MIHSVIIDPNALEDDVLRMLEAKAESEDCCPAESLRLLLNELAAGGEGGSSGTEISGGGEISESPVDF